MKSHTQQLSEFLADLRYEDIPEDVVAQIKRLSIHVIGVSIAAAPIAQAKRTISLSEARGGAAESTVWGGSGKKIPAESASFANATLSDILDWEDCSWTGHPSAGAIPVAFALAEAGGLSGRDYITAVTAAYEGYQRIAMAVQPSVQYAAEYGWGLSSWQIFAASIAAAKALGLDGDKINQTIGASVYAAPVPSNLHSSGNAKSDIYHYAHGTNAYNGLFAAKLAEIGFSDGKDYLDGKNGYWRHVSDRVDESWYTKDLGARWLINEVYIKHWPANMWIQTPLEILDHLYADRPFSADDVAKIRLSPDTNLTSSDYAASGRTTLDAQFNAAFCLASYILDPKPSARWFIDEKLNEPKVMELASSFEAFGDKTTPWENFLVFKEGSFPEMTLEIHLKDGTVRAKTEAFPKGHPQNNTSLDEEYRLFREITEDFLPVGQAERIIDRIDNLENLKNLDEIARNTVAERV
jgi:2-methylcitrate dehydratase PrpD